MSVFSYLSRDVFTLVYYLVMISYSVVPIHFHFVTSRGLNKRGYTLESLPDSISTAKQEDRVMHSRKDTPLYNIIAGMKI